MNNSDNIMIYNCGVVVLSLFLFLFLFLFLIV